MWCSMTFALQSALWHLMLLSLFFLILWHIQNGDIIAQLFWTLWWEKDTTLLVLRIKLSGQNFIIWMPSALLSFSFFFSLQKYDLHWSILKHNWWSSYTLKTYEIVRTRFVSVRQSCKIILQQLYNIRILVNIVFC
jgi:hypothetical protein